MDRRRACGLHAEHLQTILPAPSSSGGWSTAPLSTAEFGIILKGLLVDGNFPRDAISNIGAQSCKATALSWAAKAAVPRDDRRALGYHIKQGDRTMEAYSRDAMAGSLRCLVQVLADIRGGRFAPDTTRSGYIAAASSTCSSSAAAASSLPGSDIDKIEEVTKEADEMKDEFVINLATQLVHRVSGVHLVCGKAFPVKHTTASECPQGSRRCSGCF